MLWFEIISSMQYWILMKNKLPYCLFNGVQWPKTELRVAKLAALSTKHVVVTNKHQLPYLSYSHENREIPHLTLPKGRPIKQHIFLISFTFQHIKLTYLFPTTLFVTSTTHKETILTKTLKPTTLQWSPTITLVVPFSSFHAKQYHSKNYNFPSFHHIGCNFVTWLLLITSWPH